jgi:hypothetical protein
MRLGVAADTVTWGGTTLPPDAGGLADYIWSLAPDSGAVRDVRFVFAGNVPVGRVREMAEAAGSAGSFSNDFHVYFNVTGRYGDDFSLDCSTGFCCEPRRFVIAGEDPPIPPAPESGGFWRRMEIAIQEDGITVDGQMIDPGDLRDLLLERREAVRGVVVEIGVPENKSIAEILPVLEICQHSWVEMSLVFETEEQETRFRHLQQQMMHLKRMPFPPPHELSLLLPVL